MNRILKKKSFWILAVICLLYAGLVWLERDYYFTDDMDIRGEAVAETPLYAISRAEDGRCYLYFPGIRGWSSSGSAAMVSYAPPDDPAFSSPEDLRQQLLAGTALPYPYLLWHHPYPGVLEMFDVDNIYSARLPEDAVPNGLTLFLDKDLGRLQYAFHFTAHGQPGVLEPLLRDEYLSAVSAANATPVENGVLIETKYDGVLYCGEVSGTYFRCTLPELPGTPDGAWLSGFGLTEPEK